MFFLGDKPYQYCLYDVFDSQNGQLVSDANAIVIILNQRKVLQINNVTDSHPYILKIHSADKWIEMSRIRDNWRIEVNILPTDYSMSA